MCVCVCGVVVYMCIYTLVGCCQLQQMIMKLVKESFGDSQYRKALDCIRCLRRECLQVL